MTFEATDHISIMPQSRFRSEPTTFSDDHLVPQGVDLDHLANDMWQKYQSGDETGAMIDSIVERYGIATHEENVAYGERIQALRAGIEQTASIQGIHLQAVKRGTQVLSSELIGQFQELHDTATALALKNFGLVAFVVANTPEPFVVNRTKNDFQDLVQEGWFAIYQAALRYNPWKNINNTGNPEDALHFSSLAGKYIKGYIKKYLPFLLRIKIARHNLEEIYAYYEIRNDLKAQRGSYPSDEEVVARVKLITRERKRHPTEDKVAEYIDGAKKRGTLGRMIERFRDLVRAVQTESTEEPHYRSFRDSQGNWVTEELEPNEPGTNDDSNMPETEANNTILREQIMSALNVLTKRERRVLEMRFGLIDGVDHTLEETGSRFGLTRERIRQIETKAMRKLRHPSRARRLRDYIT